MDDAERDFQIANHNCTLEIISRRALTDDELSSLLSRANYLAYWQRHAAAGITRTQPEEQICRAGREYWRDLQALVQAAWPFVGARTERTSAGLYVYSKETRQRMAQLQLDASSHELQGQFQALPPPDSMFFDTPNMSEHARFCAVYEEVLEVEWQTLPVLISEERVNALYPGVEQQFQEDFFAELLNSIAVQGEPTVPQHSLEDPAEVERRRQLRTLLKRLSLNE